MENKLFIKSNQVESPVEATEPEATDLKKYFIGKLEVCFSVFDISIQNKS